MDTECWTRDWNGQRYKWFWRVIGVGNGWQKGGEKISYDTIDREKMRERVMGCGEIVYLCTGGRGVRVNLGFRERINQGRSLLTTFQYRTLNFNRKILQLSIANNLM